MKTNIRILAIGGFMAAALCASAQNTASGYFLDEYTYRYQMNPAMGNEKGFVSMPGLGNVNVAVRGNLHLSSVLYNVNGKTCLFTNPGVSAAEALDGFHDKNKLSSDVKINVLSLGFKAFKGYNTISVNARANVNAIVPKSFIQLAKEGATNRTYDITDLKASGTGYAEVAFNHSHDIKQVPGLRVGGTVKALLGVASLDARLNNAHLTLGENEWTATTNGEIFANIGGFQYEMEKNKTGHDYVHGANLDGDGSVGVNGFGMAFDLGATYKWGDWEFSLAALDLGWITYNKTQVASTNGDRTFNTDAYIFNPDNDAPNSFSKEWKNMRNGLEDLYQMDNNGEQGTHKMSLGTTVNAGVRYELPVYRKLHLGLLSTTRLQGKYSWTECRLSANVAPAKCFSADVNVVAGTYGMGFGWLLNFHHTGFNFFLGMDQTLGKVTKQFAPLNSNASVNLGMNFLF